MKRKGLQEGGPVGLGLWSPGQRRVPSRKPSGVGGMAWGPRFENGVPKVLSLGGAPASGAGSHVDDGSKQVWL